MVGQFYGHDGVGTEIIDYGRDDPVDDDAYREFQRQRLFTALCGVYGIERINHAVKPLGDLDGLPGGQDWITAFGVNFDCVEDWTLAAWRHFLDRAGHLLNDDGAVFMELIKSRLPEEHWAYLGPLSRTDEFARPWIAAAILRDLPDLPSAA